MAAGFAFWPVLQVAGALLLTAGLLGLAWLTARHAATAAPDRLTAWLLLASAGAVPAAMLLALWWAAGTAAGFPVPSIAVMTSTHGVLNALGTTFLGVLGWRRLTRVPVTV